VAAGNDEWQATVLELLAESQVVVLQPASTEGIWWEVERSIQSLPPERLLLCMVNYRDRQNDYETFRIRLGRLLPETVSVPRATGCRPSNCFFRFGRDWQPVELAVVNHRFFVWPFKGHAVNFKKTLGPFLAGAGVDGKREVLAARAAPHRAVIGSGREALPYLGRA
jgi:hypothetical protein